MPNGNSKDLSVEGVEELFSLFSLPYTGTVEEQEIGENRCARLIAEAREAFGPLVWVATHSFGGRHIEVTAEPVTLISDWGLDGEGWYGYRIADVRVVEFTSATSGSTLRWENGVVEYFHGPDPSYQGAYWRAFQALA